MNDWDCNIMVNYKENVIDAPGSTWIMIGCNRETTRLDRVLRVFHAVSKDAHSKGDYDRLRNNLVALHDHKGNLVAIWRNEKAREDMSDLVDRAWLGECESREVNHLIGNEFQVRTIIEVGAYHYEKRWTKSKD